MCQHACWYTLLPTQDCLSDLHLLKQKKWRGRSDLGQKPKVRSTGGAWAMPSTSQPRHKGLC